jgi:hypothetical protein
MSEAQLFAYRGDWLFAEIMTDQVFFLTKNYCVRCEKFKALLERFRVGRTTADDAEKMMKIHHVFYMFDKEIKDKIENHDRKMWLFSNNNDVTKKNVDKLVKISKRNKLPVARLYCWYDRNKKQPIQYRYFFPTGFCYLLVRF